MLNILLPVDGSEIALDGVRHALRLVHKGLQARFVLAHVEPEPSLYEIVTTRDPDVAQSAAEAAAEDAFAPARQLLDALNISYTCEFALGDPSRVLVEMIDRLHCDAVIMGAAEMSDVHSAFFGSVSHAVLNKSKVPVTLVRHPQAQLS